MGIQAQTTTRAHIGTSTNSDAFQGGREAAQMAQNQAPKNSANLIFAIGPSQPSFQEFVEGVRVVVGEDNLVAIPTSHIISKDFFSTEHFLVLMVYSSFNRFSVASAEANKDNLSAGITSLLTQFRKQRGNETLEFDHNGILLFDTILSGQNINSTHQVALEYGLNSWVMGLRPHMQVTVPMVGKDKSIMEGFIGIECLSDSIWAVGEVSLSSFKNHPEVIPEAVKSAIRDAKGQRENEGTAFGLLMFNFPMDDIPRNISAEIKNIISETAPEFPLIGIVTDYQYKKFSDVSTTNSLSSITTKLAPQ